MMTTGHVINLISNDVHRLDKALLYIPNIVLAPFAFLAGNVVLFYLIGWPALIGTSYLFLILVYQGYGSRLAADLRQKAVVLADKRIQMINEIIRGVRTIKICSWEEYFGKSVSAVRGLVKFCSHLFLYFRGLLWLSYKLDALKAFNRASKRKNKLHFSSKLIKHNKSNKRIEIFQHNI